MSVVLFRNFSNALKRTLPKISYNQALKTQLRFTTAMETVTKEETELVSNKNFTRFKRRQWETNNETRDEVDAKRLCEDGAGEPVKFERIKRKKVAILLGYSGVDYYGMQRNPGVRTIEEDLLKALHEAGYITEDEFKNQQNAQFQRSSRTDKGVSASRQVVSLKLPLEYDIEEINKRLPECIRVFGIKRVTNKFNSKTKCNARSYSYTLPTYVFEPSLVTEEQRKAYRISAEKLEKVNSLLSVYKGTKRYHNFTEKKYYADPSSLRFMMSFAVDRVFVESEMEFAVLIVKGQSFMLHQIRKMIGLVIAVARGHTDYSTLEKAFGREKVMIPTAPGLGLVLDMVHYDRYDAKFKDSHDSLVWDEVEPTVQAFTREQIYPSIVKGEIEGQNMAIWFEKLAKHSYEPNEETDVKDGTDTAKVDSDDEVDSEAVPDSKAEEQGVTSSSQIGVDSEKDVLDSGKNEVDSSKDVLDSAKNEDTKTAESQESEADSKVA